MFKLQPDDSFWAKVKIDLPGEPKPGEIEIRFRWKTRDQLVEFDESAKRRNDIENLTDLILDWRGIDAEYSQDNLAALLNNYPRAALAIVAAYRAEVLEAKAKN